MTQDQPGQAQGTGYVVRGEVVPDEETQEFQTDDQSGPMTRLRKVASAMRGEKSDQTVPNQTAATSPDRQDPNGSWPTRSAEPGAMSSPAPEDEMDDGEYADATRPNDVGAVRSPEDGNGDYWDDQQNMRATARDRGMEATVPDTGIDPVDTGGTAPAPLYESQADTPTGHGSQADTATGHGSQADTAPGYSSPADT